MPSEQSLAAQNYEQNKQEDLVLKRFEKKDEPSEEDRFKRINVLFQEILESQRTHSQKDSQSDTSLSLLIALASETGLILEKNRTNLIFRGESLKQPITVEATLSPIVIATKILTADLKNQQSLEHLRPYLQERYQTLQLRPTNDVSEAVGWYLMSIGAEPSESGAVRMIEELKVRENLSMKILEKHFGVETKNLKLLSFSGSTCVVYTDAEQTHVYKVYLPDNDESLDEPMEFGEKSRRYSNHEIEIVQRLGQAKICPADLDKRSRPAKILENGEYLPAVVVMEHVTIGLVTKTELPLLAKEIARLSQELSTHNAMPDGAAEIAWDKKLKRLVILDPAELRNETITPDQAALWIAERIPGIVFTEP